MNLNLKQLEILIDTVKTQSGRNEVELIGNRKTFKELIELGFPLNNFKHVEVLDEPDEQRLWVIPAAPKPPNGIKIIFER